MSDRGPTAPPPDAPSTGYEKRDVNVRGIVTGMIIGVLVIVVSLIGLNQLYVLTREEVVKENVLSQMDPRLRELRARDTRILTTYGVVDKARGLYRIPIDRAMELMAEEAYQKQQARGAKK
jgi:hypothetical protein